MKNKIIILVSMIVVLAGLTGCDKLFWEKYTNREYGFSILLPRWWQREGANQHWVVVAKSPIKGKDDVFQENINIVVTDLPEAVPLDTFFELNKAETLRILPGVETGIQEGEISSGGRRGRWLSFETQRPEGIRLRIISAVWMKNNRVFIVTGSCWAEEQKTYEPMYRRMLRSMVIK